MDPALSSLFPIHQIGADGFSWWVGQIESEKNADPKKSGRYRVRVVGQHLKACDATPTDQLPWAQVMMPVTTPFSDGGVTGATVDLRQGNWVVGFYLDNDKQKPIIMGSIGHTAGSTKRSNVEKDPAPGETCKSFTTYLSPEVNPNLHTPLESGAKRNGDQPASSTTAEDTGTTKPGEAGQIAAAVDNQMPPAFYGLFAEASTTNPTGNKVCVEIANPNCGSENDMKGGLTNIVGEMLKATQQSGGNIGTYYVSQINGELNSYIDHGMQYVNKAVRLVKSFIARVKGEIVKLLREGVDQLVELLLYEKVAEETAEEAAEEGKQSEIDKVSEAEEPATKKQSRIKPVIDTINDVLDDLGCSMADLTDTLAQWLTDLLLGYLMDAFSNAVCLVDNLVDGIINQILAFIDSFINTILGPIQELLALIASPLDMIGNAVNKVLNLLGISCDGPSDSCEKITKECTDCGTGETEDWLDKLLDAIEDGPLDGNTYVCEEAKTTSALESLPPTEVIFVGGIFPPSPPSGGGNNVIPSNLIINYSSDDIEVTEGEQAIFTITRSGNVAKPSSLTMTIIGGTATEGEDYKKIYTGSSIGFAPGATSKQIIFETYKDDESEGPETFFIKLEPNVTPEGLKTTFKGGNVHKCTILNFDEKNPPSPPDTGTDTTYTPPPYKKIKPVSTKQVTESITPQDIQVVSITTDKVFYSEGEIIYCNVTTENVPGGTTYNYSIEGTIDENDIEGGLTGSFTLDADGKTGFIIETVVNDDNDDTTIPDPIESLSIYVDNTDAYVDVFIVGEEDVLSTDTFWSVTSDVNYVSEGDTVTFTVSTLNVPDGINFTYKIDGAVSVTDLVGYRLTSNVDVNNNLLEIQNSKCVLPIQIAVDSEETEPQEAFRFIVDSYNVPMKFSVNHNSNQLTAVKTVINGVESDDISLIIPGMKINPSVNTLLIEDDIFVDTVNYVDKTITLSGNVKIYGASNSNVQLIDVQALASKDLEDVNTRVVILPDAVVDADVAAASLPVYFVTTDKLEYNEGETITYTIDTLNVVDGTVLEYVLYGDNISKSDFTNNSLLGQFTVINNQAKVYISIAEDSDFTEKPETVTFFIKGTGASADVIIISEVADEVVDVPDISDPCFTKPVAGKPITDGNGSIISIPIEDPGCPYVFPPKVIITGPGYGASAIALTDSDGKVTEIRVTKSGIGYNLNRPENFDLRCVIDSYTIIKPGKGYTEAPDVYVDGVAGRAEAVIDERGYVISIKPTDRTTTYNEIPTVQIIGGGGLGAKVIPSITCLDTKQYEDQGYAKIGTGRYVDCP